MRISDWSSDVCSSDLSSPSTTSPGIGRGQNGTLMAFKTRITAMLGIEHPIVQGGMQSVGYAGLASAVSTSRGLGILTALTPPSPTALPDEMDRCRDLTHQPFRANITVLPHNNPPEHNP